MMYPGEREEKEGAGYERTIREIFLVMELLCISVVVMDT